MKQWYEALFSNYANNYDNECYTQGTKTEVDFLESEIGYNREARILDIGCGTGRHSIELAARGYKVCGVDLSENMLGKAKEKAKMANVDIEFLQRDARHFSFPEKFDLAIMLCEGGFSLMETDEMNFAILRNAVQSLKPGGKFIFTCLNALFPLSNSVMNLADGEIKQVHKGSFDIMQFRDFATYEIADDDGVTNTYHCNERYYVPSEISFMLTLLGVKKVEIFGAEIGLYSRETILQPNHFELLVVAGK